MSCVCASQNNDFQSLEVEINNSAQIKQLNLTKDYINSVGDYKDGILIDIDDFVINGQGHTIDACKKSRVFNIKSKNVILKNIYIKNAYQEGYGGSIYSEGSNTTIINSTFENCNSTNSGGAIFFKSTGSITNSIFKNNSAYFGGAVDFEDTALISNSKFTNNYATFLGGAVYCSNWANISNNEIIANTAGDGAGIYFFSTGLVNNTLFSQNYAIGYGGAITSDREVEIYNSKFIKNYAKYAGSIYFKDSGNLADSSFIENNASEGGAIMTNGGFITINNCEFNHSFANKGVSIYIGLGSMKIENTIFNNNISLFENEIYVSKNNLEYNNLSFRNVALPILVNTSSNVTVISKIIVKSSKIKTLIVAKSKTFKSSLKIKKYSVILKTINKKIVKYRKVTFKIRGKTYSKKTNSKGIAIFKFKLSKKGKYKAKIVFSGDNKYYSYKKTVLIKIK